MFIIGYDCITSSGNGFEAMMESLYSGFDNSTNVEPDGGKVCFLKNRNLSTSAIKDQFISSLSEIFNNIVGRLSEDLKNDFSKKRVGVIFCTTKGCIEDYIWKGDLSTFNHDPYESILNGFIAKNAQAHFSFSCTLSNACSSSHVGVEYAQELFAQDRLDYILIIAGDLIGPFVYKGFNSLKVLTHTANAPFDQLRTGLQLGDGMAGMLLAKESQADEGLKIDSVSSETEGALITRPSVNGHGLLEALHRAKNSQAKFSMPDFVIAHGTGTTFNDLTEDSALSQFFSNEKNKPPVTGTKWSVGHTLGASGLLDFIAACEVIKNQNLFPLSRTTAVDPKFEMNYFLSNEISSPNRRPMRRALITSLGFGGIHAALFLSKRKLGAE